MFFINKNFNWDEFNISKENQRFFVLRWYEIFNENTFDSWQVRTANAASILNEIYDSTYIIEQLHEYHTNIDKLINELKSVIDNDLVIKKYYKFLGEFIKKIQEIYESSIKNESRKNIPYFRNIIKVALSRLDDYKTHLYNEIENTLKSDEIQKNDLYSLVLHLGTQLQNDGFSIKDLRNSIDIFLNNSKADFLERFKDFKQQYAGSCDCYECHFIIKWTKSSEDFPKFTNQKISFYEGKTEGISEMEKSFYEKYPNEVFACVEIESCDYFSARENAEILLENLFSLKKLFLKEKEISIKHSECLIKKDNETKIIEKETSRKFYIKDSKNSDEHVVTFADMLMNINSNDSQRIISSLEYHKLGILSSSNEARLVNLWIALETLIPEEKSSIISRICSYVPSSITTEYINQLLRETCKLIKPLLKRPEKKLILKKLEIKTEHYITPKDLLNILLDVKHGKRIKLLLELVGDNTLLVYRICKLWEKFNEANKLCKFINNHHDNIELQLNRIYRARNGITHHGSSGYPLAQLIQHLHTYYIGVVHNLRHDLTENKSFSIHEALIYRKTLYQYISMELKDYKNKPFDPNNLISVDKLFKGDNELSTIRLDKWI